MESKEQSSPLGLMPRYIHNSLRVKEICSAIERYCEAKKEIPQEWFDELTLLSCEITVVNMVKNQPEIEKESQYGKWFSYDDFRNNKVSGTCFWVVGIDGSKMIYFVNEIKRFLQSDDIYCVMPIEVPDTPDIKR